MSIKKLTAENAVIKTAFVEVKTLTISGKQVTLAVFRQLPKEDLISLRDLKMNGVPWGHVNYHPDKCSEASTHLHVVWQKTTQLLRATVPRRVDHLYPYEGNIQTHASEWAVSKLDGTLRCPQCDERFTHLEFTRTICRNGHKLTDDEFGRRRKALAHWRYNYNSGFLYDLTCRGQSLRAEFTDSSLRNSLDGHDLLSKFYKLALEWWEGQGSPSTDDANVNLMRATEGKQKWLFNYGALYESLAAQDQLYIAV